MIRSFAVSLAAGVILVSTAASGAGESFPVIHRDPITVRIVGGKDGRPMGRLHLTLIAGYDQGDMRGQAFREEVLTDAHGQVRLSNQLENLPWLQVWVGGKPLCQRSPRRAGFSVELIRRDGLSSPNSCGKATVEDQPGVFTVFVKGKGVAAVPAVVAAAPPIVPAVTAPPAAAPAAVTPIAVAHCSCACSKKPRRCGHACVRAKAVGRGLAWCFRQ